jgi:putative SOS response-associated peptidase YedK
MCNLYSTTKPVDEMRQLFKVSTRYDHLGNFKPLDPIFPKHQAPTMRVNANNQIELLQMAVGIFHAQAVKAHRETNFPICLEQCAQR